MNNSNKKRPGPSKPSADRKKTTPESKPAMAKRWVKEQKKTQGKGSFKKLPKKVKHKDNLFEENILGDNND